MINLIKEKSFTLLRNLERNDYKLTNSDQELMNHKSFNRYRSEHVKKLVNGSFFRAVRDLLENGWLTYEDFEEITKPVSHWYRQQFINSFNYHCTDPKGQFYEQCKGKTFNKKDVIKNDKSELKECFTCK